MYRIYSALIEIVAAAVFIILFGAYITSYVFITGNELLFIWYWVFILLQS